mmetsp:Transcript_62431/g.136580  ORF Transcript_62431/g.136580 Transcript_62431/m.136580 type:complete len:221 (-) Transcript_62431:199-861(-)
MRSSMARGSKSSFWVCWLAMNRSLAISAECFPAFPCSAAWAARRVAGTPCMSSRSTTGRLPILAAASRACPASLEVMVSGPSSRRPKQIFSTSLASTPAEIACVRTPPAACCSLGSADLGTSRSTSSMASPYLPLISEVSETLDLDRGRCATTSYQISCAKRLLAGRLYSLMRMAQGSCACGMPMGTSATALGPENSSRISRSRDLSGPSPSVKAACGPT